MSEDKSGPAYPNFEQNEDGLLYTTEKGMTKRERFAMAAMRSIVITSNGMPNGEIAFKACKIADALLKELEK